MRSVAAFLRALAPIVFLGAAAGSTLLGGCGLLPDVIDETASWSANRLYSEAKNAMADGSYDKAIKYFEKLEARFPYGRYAQQAQLEVAYAYFRQAERASAIAACDRFIRLHPNHPNVDYAYYLKGLANFNEDLGLLGHISMQDLTERDPKAARDSFEAFKALVAKYPESRYTPDATARMKYLVNAMASHEVHVARYYMKREAYIAAINRAQTAIKTYPDAPANEEALFVMVKAYDLLGMNDLRDDAERVMRKNFPTSVYYERGLDRAVPWWKLW
ncbi:outer membrane protein assembly factor BamD [Sulfuritalea sp.]|uniref:outer membrane protein assembly factor BamD n=1 Tax=Sulfuritalea sp. TaxID=2480090 RepID=UPI001AC8FD54|nr:outer membrane protein assembly factor BamD [Sulfuritalea sp.]MBN8475796.1 outer membrane protein assembly factor BamD [Sulfuritalea sp.]